MRALRFYLFACSVACPDGGYQEYRLTVIHFALNKEVELVVRKTGGDLSQLDSDEIHFQPSMLLVSGLLQYVVK